MADYDPSTNSYGSGGDYAAVDNFVCGNWLQHHQAVESRDEATKNGRTVSPLAGEATPAQ